MTDPGDAGQGGGQTVVDQAVGESGGHSVLADLSGRLTSFCRWLMLSSEMFRYLMFQSTKEALYFPQNLFIIFIYIIIFIFS